LGLIIIQEKEKKRGKMVLVR
jgi:hypothetical protein